MGRPGRQVVVGPSYDLGRTMTVGPTPGKAPARRNAEIMVVQEVMRWRREVERFSPERLDEFDAGIRHALEHPAAPAAPGGPGSNIKVRDGGAQSRSFEARATARPVFFAVFIASRRFR